jgi:ribosomal protein S18 acetylase RimI-like enzyme
MTTESAAIEDATEADRPALMELFGQAVRASYPDLARMTRSEARERIEAQWAWYRDQGGHVRVTRAPGGEVSACCWSLPTHHPVTGVREWFIVILAVDPGHRRQGLGRLLLDDARSQARRAGIHRLRLFTHTANVAARSLYREVGFEAATVELVLHGEGSRG